LFAAASIIAVARRSRAALAKEIMITAMAMEAAEHTASFAVP